MLTSSTAVPQTPGTLWFPTLRKMRRQLHAHISAKADASLPGWVINRSQRWSARSVWTVSLACVSFGHEEDSQDERMGSSEGLAP